MGKPNYQNALSFVSSGVACFALIHLDSIGILDEIVKSNTFEKGKIKAINDDLVLQTALLELEMNGIINQDNENLSLTSFGREVVHYLGLILYIYKGYCGILSNPKAKSNIDHAAIVKGSNYLADEFIDVEILRELRELSFEGTICDLGCGDGSRIAKICQLVGCIGLGIDIECRSANDKNPIHNLVHICAADITNLKDKWIDVQLIIQVMVMHDFTPEDRCIKVMDSYLSHFPNLKFFFFCDIVAPCKFLKSQLPGFDYIHSILGIKTRTYDETIDLFKKTNYEVYKEIPLEKMPNTYLWILTPK